jgi:hypothetical protein
VYVKYTLNKIKILKNLKVILLFFLGIGDWGLGIGDWGLAQSPIPPIPNPQSPTTIFILYLNFKIILNINIYYQHFKNSIK